MALLKVLARTVVIGVGLVVVTPISTASACSPPHCSPEYFLPFEGEVPANIAGIQWLPGRRPITTGGTELSTADDLSFQCENAAGELYDITFHVEVDAAVQLIVPDEALVAGERCEIGLNENIQRCDPLGYMAAPAPTYLLSVAEFVVKQTASQPQMLGELHAQDAAVQTVLHSSGLCSRHEAPICAVAVDLALAEDAALWGDALAFETLVDGEVWQSGRYFPFRFPTGGSFEGRGKDLIYAQTEFMDDGTAEGTTFGTHTVVMRATLPGTDVMLETAPIEITLGCSTPKKHDDGCTVSAHGPRSLSTIMTLCFASLMLVLQRVRSSRATSRSPRARV